ncbi:MAG: pyruvate/2-oxoglutarate dehydrogenase complex dihydrolipoamide acyltransferase (E2) component [Paraglaciecola sp.]|jgi:pyruvate/2-oxoglutarate dehydrogenase complex dihydrolipoamide acyltransferase (E2) component
MAIDISVPNDLWEEDSEAVITTWLTSDGNEVSKGDLLAEVMCEKIQYEIFAPADGKLSISKDADEIVKKGDVIGVVI